VKSAFQNFDRYQPEFESFDRPDEPM